MVIAEGTRSKTGDVEGLALALQEIMKKLDSVDSRMISFDSILSTIETVSIGGSSKGELTQGIGGMATEFGRRQPEYTEDRVTRQTKVEFTVFDGSRIHDWIPKVRDSSSWTRLLQH